jgi:hypothetical protein
MNRIATPLFGVCLLAAPAMAQEAMKPGPEHARIGYFAGTWQYDGDAKESPMGPGGKITNTETCEWFAGGFSLVCRSDGANPRGPVKGGAVWGFDPAQRKYTYYGYNSFGEAFYVLGQVSGQVWTWNFEMPMEGGAKAEGRVTLTEQSPTAFSFRFELSTDGTNWMLMEEGRATKRR